MSSKSGMLALFHSTYILELVSKRSMNIPFSKKNMLQLKITKEKDSHFESDISPINSKRVIHENNGDVKFPGAADPSFLGKQENSYQMENYQMYIEGEDPFLKKNFFSKMENSNCRLKPRTTKSSKDHLHYLVNQNSIPSLSQINTQYFAPGISSSARVTPRAGITPHSIFTPQGQNSPTPESLSMCQHQYFKNSGIPKRKVVGSSTNVSQYIGYQSANVSRNISRNVSANTSKVIEEPNKKTRKKHHRRNQTDLTANSSILKKEGKPKFLNHKLNVFRLNTLSKLQKINNVKQNISCCNSHRDNIQEQCMKARNLMKKLREPWVSHSSKNAVDVLPDIKVMEEAEKARKGKDALKKLQNLGRDSEERFVEESQELIIRNNLIPEKKNERRETLKQIDNYINKTKQCMNVYNIKHGGNLSHRGFAEVGTPTIHLKPLSQRLLCLRKNLKRKNTVVQVSETNIQVEKEKEREREKELALERERENKDYADVLRHNYLTLALQNICNNDLFSNQLSPNDSTHLNYNNKYFPQTTGHKKSNSTNMCTQPSHAFKDITNNHFVNKPPPINTLSSITKELAYP
jgi:hypothetical protein